MKTMNRMIKASLEKNLSQDVLDYLNEEFQEQERCLQKIKELEYQIQWLLKDISKKDDLVLQCLDRLKYSIPTEMQQVGYYPQQSPIMSTGIPEYQPVTYQNTRQTPSQEFVYRRNNPRNEVGFKKDYSDEEYNYYDPYMRGNPGKGDGKRGGPRGFTSANQGGSGGSSGGQGGRGTTSHYRPYLEEPWPLFPNPMAPSNERDREGNRNPRNESYDNQEKYSPEFNPEESEEKK